MAAALVHCVAVRNPVESVSSKLFGALMLVLTFSIYTKVNTCVVKWRIVDWYRLLYSWQYRSRWNTTSLFYKSLIVLTPFLFFTVLICIEGLREKGICDCYTDKGGSQVNLDLMRKWSCEPVPNVETKMQNQRKEM